MSKARFVITVDTDGLPAYRDPERWHLRDLATFQMRYPAKVTVDVEPLDGAPVTTGPEPLVEAKPKPKPEAKPKPKPKPEPPSDGGNPLD